jgi:hypothetical protein
MPTSTVYGALGGRRAGCRRVVTCGTVQCAAGWCRGMKKVVN